MSCVVAISLIVSVVLLSASVQAGQTIIGAARVIDGDTIEVAGEKIRLAGIDAPEKSQHCCASLGAWQCGERATELLEQMTHAQRITCDVIKKGRYGRAIARCNSGAKDVSAELVEQGLAVVYRYKSKKRGWVAPDKQYVRAETLAKKDARGIWASKFTQPSRWRKGDRIYCN